MLLDMNTIRQLTVFCASSFGCNDKYKAMTLSFAQQMIEYKMDLVYGGGNRGLMGILADTLKQQGRQVIGVLPKRLNIPQVRTKDVENQVIITEGMHQRKETMYKMGDAFVALPGGIGTVEEIMEIYTWLQLGYHTKPVGLLNAFGYYDFLLAFLQHSCQEGFLHKEHLDALVIDSNPKTLIDKLINIKMELPDKITQ